MYKNSDHKALVFISFHILRLLIIERKKFKNLNPLNLRLNFPSFPARRVAEKTIIRACIGRHFIHVHHISFASVQ